jgi:3-isopropylmalate/(R)-2-methylmalate dehydratase small subunit
MNQTPSDEASPAMAFRTLRSRVIPLPIDNVDTDQIIPARYLKGVDRRGLAAGLFANWRDDPTFALNQAHYRGAEILLAGENFGCGSSREHAPWALQEYGFRALVSSRFGDIFTSNALKNGLLPIVLPAPTTRDLLERAASPEGLYLEIDLESQRVRTVVTNSADETSALEWPFEIDRFARRCLLDGVDQLGYLLRQIPAIERWEEANATLPTPTTTMPLENR